jgi:hypothetical protein
MPMLDQVLAAIHQAYVWYLAHKTPFEVGATICSFVGITFAVLSIQSGRKLTRDLRSIFDHLTTREAGTFPAYMSDIEKLIGGARESIVIACDFPGYGAWVDHGHYSSYVKALENRKAERVRRSQPLRIEILTLDAEGRARALEERFPDDRWKDYVKKGGFSRSRRLYEELENCVVPESRPQFITEMINRQNRALHADFRFADCHEYAGMMPMHFWIADGEKAVFAIPGKSGELADHGFVTEEAGLVESLLAIWERYLEASTKPALKQVSSTEKDDEQGTSRRRA